jgi:hypothetical protein
MSVIVKPFGATLKQGKVALFLNINLDLVFCVNS